MRAFLLVILLAGCTNTGYVDRPVEVKVMVPVPCLSPDDVPPPMIYPVDELEPGVSDGEIIGALSAERTQRIETERLLRNLITACIGQGDLP